jgi:hypothetical protein
MQMRYVVGLFVIVAVGIGLALFEYMSRGDKDHTKAATGAMAAVADAAHRITTDRTSYAVEVATRVGMGRIGGREEQMAMVAAIAVRGSASLADICTALPRVRDSVNTVVTDSIRPMLRDATQIRPDDLAGDARTVLASLNRLLQSEAVTAVQLSLKPTREAQDSGCPKP